MYNHLNSFLRTFAEKHCDENEYAEKYGTNFENDKFMMHRYCWCDQEGCPWCDGDIMPGFFESFGVESERGAPNFWYKPMDFKVWWYKYIGRDTQTNKPITYEIINAMMLDSGLTYLL